MSVLTHYLVHTQPPERQDFYEEVLELLTSFQHAESTEKLTALMNAMRSSQKISTVERIFLLCM